MLTLIEISSTRAHDTRYKTTFTIIAFMYL